MGRPKSKETRIVPVPKGASVYTNGRVMDKASQYDLPNDIVIGHAISKVEMVPNQNYFRFHMREYRQFDPEGACTFLPGELKAGLYTLVLTTAQRFGIYNSLVQRFGTIYANAIMDYVMFLLKNRDNNTVMMSHVLRNDITFTGAPYDDSWYSRFWSTDKDDLKIHLVKEDWLRTCSGMGISEAYLVLDGSNVDCAAKRIVYSTPGEAKSGKKVRVLGFMWAICASGDMAGMPLTYHLTKGGLVDARSVRKAVTTLHTHKIQVKGIICDRGFCVSDLLVLLQEVKLPYIIMLQSSIEGVQTMKDRYIDRLRDWKFEDYTGDGEFGVIDKVRLFSSSNVESNVALLYNPSKAASHCLKLIDKATNEVQRIQENIQNGHRASVSKDMTKYICIEGKGKDRKVIVDSAKLEEDYKSGGFAAIAVLQDMSAKEAREIYALRQACEKPFTGFKSQLGCAAFRIHKTPSARKKFFTCFQASIVRFGIQTLCKELNLSTNPIISDLEEIHYCYVNQQYVYADSCFAPQEKLLEASGVKLEDLKRFSGEVSRRYIGCLGEADKVRSIYQAFPWIPGKEPEGISQQPSESDTPNGEVNEGTASSPQSKEPDSDTPKIRKRRPGGGRKKGSKNKKTLEREEEERRLRECGEYVEPVKRPRGRPKGSKDKGKRAPRGSKVKPQKEP